MNRRSFVAGTVACFAGASGFVTPSVALADRPLTELHLDDLRDLWLQVSEPSDAPNSFSQWLMAYLDYRRRSGERIRLVYGKHHRVYGVKLGIRGWRMGGLAYFVANEAVDRYDGVDHVWKSRHREPGRYVAGTNERIA